MLRSSVHAPMPSTLHEILIELFRENQTLAPVLLSEVFGISLPQYTQVRREEAQLTEIVPTEYRADLVLLLMVESKPVRGRKKTRKGDGSRVSRVYF